MIMTFGDVGVSSPIRISCYLMLPLLSFAWVAREISESELMAERHGNTKFYSNLSYFLKPYRKGIKDFMI